jgi:hypothetical protein
MSAGSRVEDAVGRTYLAEALRVLRQYRELADGAIAQVPQADWFRAPDPESNSLVVLMQHLAGNMRSRWTEFLTSDGEKPDRNRDGEFEVEGGTTAEGVRARWEDGWRRVVTALEPLGPDDLLKTVMIGGKPYTVLEAIDRAIAHYAYHVGQIVFLAKQLRGADWRTLSDPKRRK